MGTTRKNDIPQVPSQLDPGIDLNPVPDSECPCNLKVSDFSHITASHNLFSLTVLPN